MKPLAPTLSASALVLALFLPSALPAQTTDTPRILRGKATVLDAGTLSIAGRPAADALQTRIGSATVTCAVDVQKHLDHLFRPRESFSGVCYLGDSTGGPDLNGWLVRHGWARVRSLGSVKRYLQEETAAKAEQAGAWHSRRKYRWCCTGLPDSDNVRSEILPGEL